MKKPLLFWACLIAGIVCLLLAAYYWFTPAGSLPAFVPGYEAGSSTIHVKHGLAAAIVGILAFVVAWFQSKPAEPVQA